MRAYGNIGKSGYGYYDEFYVTRSRLNQLAKKEIDQVLEVDATQEDTWGTGCECHLCTMFDFGGDIPYDKYIVKYVPL